MLPRPCREDAAERGGSKPSQPVGLATSSRATPRASGPTWDRPLSPCVVDAHRVQDMHRQSGNEGLRVRDGLSQRTSLPSVIVRPHLGMVIAVMDAVIAHIRALRALSRR